MTKGFKDKDGKFRPTGSSKSGISSNDLTVYTLSGKKQTVENYPKREINNMFNDWLKKNYEYKDKDEKEDAIVDVAIELGVETPLSKGEKTIILKKYGIIKE